MADTIRRTIDSSHFYFEIEIEGGWRKLLSEKWGKWNLRKAVGSRQQLQAQMQGTQPITQQQPPSLKAVGGPAKPQPPSSQNFLIQRQRRGPATGSPKTFNQTRCCESSSSMDGDSLYDEYDNFPCLILMFGLLTFV